MRALLCDPRVLILDDSTSSVDTETEYLIQQALDEIMKGCTTFVIAQRLLTLKNADQILVLDHGRIVEQEAHDDLLVRDGLYRQIYDLQLKDQEELATATPQRHFESMANGGSTSKGGSKRNSETKTLGHEDQQEDVSSKVAVSVAIGQAK